MKYKELDYKTLRDRVFSVIEENGETANEGIAYYLVDRLETRTQIDLELIFDFAERYGVSIDYLVGRTDKSWL